LRLLASIGFLGTCCLLLAPLAASADTSGRIVVDKSINGVRLGATQASVKKVLGRPRSTAHCSVFTGCSPVPGANPGTASWTYGPSQRKQTSYVFIKGRVALMGTFSSAERTNAGVGPGTSLTIARQRYPDLAFHKFPPGQPPSGYYMTPPPTKMGDDFTMLVIARGKVDWLEIGRWNASPKYVCDFSICS